MGLFLILSIVILLAGVAVFTVVTASWPWQVHAIDAVPDYPAGWLFWAVTVGVAVGIRVAAIVSGVG